MRRRVFGLAGLLCAALAAACMVAGRETAVDIRSELRAAAEDGSNHSLYATLIRNERASMGRRQTVTAMMPCFWSGEARAGLIDGVYRTTPGFQAGREVVQIEFDPTQTSADAIVAPPSPDDLLAEANADPQAFCRFRPATDADRRDPAFHADDQPKWYLQQTELRFIPMTPAQATRINAYLHAHRPIEPLLSPGQLSLLQRIRAHPDWKWTNHVDDSLSW